MQTPLDAFSVPPTPVFCLVTEEGVFDGLESGREQITGLDTANSWTGTTLDYKNTYNKPVIVGV